MLRVRRIVPLLALLLLPASARAALLSDPDCDDRLPQVLNVGLPQEVELPALIGRTFEKLYRDHGRCSGKRRLQVNIAIGNDYQILDWLGRGLVDVAVVPSLSLYLLQKDNVQLRELDFGGTAAGEELPENGREAEFTAFRQAVWCASLVGGPPALEAERRRCSALRSSLQPITLPSHLSTRGFLGPVAGITEWMEGKLGTLDLPEDEGERLRNRFWSKVFENARFTLEEEAGAPLRTAVHRDHLVITEPMAKILFDSGGFELRPAAIPEGFRGVLEKLDRKPPLTAFRSLFQPDPYFGVRTFGFTVEESMALLRQHQQTSGRARLALLLPGGGVKAAYQSRLVDELYKRRYLENVLAPDGAGSPRPLDVDLVVGTSGGALLGYFVSRLAENGPWTLSQVLWEKEPRVVMDSTDVFGWLDLPRYVSVLAIFLTFAFLLCLVSIPHRPLIRTGPPPERGAWRLRLWLTIWPLLLLVPVLVRTVNGRSSQEHVPEIEGLFYAVCASIAMFADQCLVLRPEGERKRPPVHPALPALAGLLLVAVPLLPVWGEEGSERWIDQPILFITAGALLVCLGCLCLLAAAFLSTYGSRRYRLEGTRDFGAGFSLSLFHVLAVYLVLAGVMVLSPGRFSLLEMTGGFWAWLLPVAFGLGVVFVGIGCARRHGTVSRGIRFLCAHHPNGSLVSRRFLRLAVITVVALAWWNFVLAPALYGNKHARQFLEGAVTRFEKEYRLVNPREDSRRLTAQLLVPANVLERDGTRYFLMVPDRLSECPSVAARLGSGASWHQFRVLSGDLPPGSPDCPEVKNVDPADVEKVIFASGSPFPIFPAHLVKLPGEEQAQALVDGGYSSNVPVDAARTASAEQVLIVESENPLGHGSSADGEESWWRKRPRLPGPLVADILRLPGFLFERSQQVDRLSKRDLFVLSLSPSREEEDWPLLFDFREPVVRRMRDVAEQDLKRRIGLVESWGPPRFQLSVQVGASGAPAR